MEQLDFNLLFRWSLASGSTRRCETPWCCAKTGTGLWRRTFRRHFLSASWGIRRSAAVSSLDHFSGGWHADRAVDVDEELSPQGRKRR